MCCAAIWGFDDLSGNRAPDGAVTMQEEGGSGEGGTPTVLTPLSEGTNPMGVAVDALAVYFVTSPGNGGGFIGRVGLDGASERALTGFFARSSGAIAIDAKNAYWTASGSVFSTPLAPSDAGALTVASSSSGAPSGVAADGTHVYWTDLNEGTVMRAKIDGASVVTLASGQKTPTSLALSAGTLYWTNQGSVDPMTGIVAGKNDGSIVSLPAGGGTPVTLASGLFDPWAITATAGGVYWTDLAGGSATKGAVYAIGPRGSATVTLASGRYDPEFIAADPSNVYWTEVYAGNVMRAPVGGGSMTTLAAGQDSPSGVAVDETSVYWANMAVFVNQSAGILKLPR